MRPRSATRIPGVTQDRDAHPEAPTRRPPFTTRTLQQEASRKLGFSPKRTMSVAQRLYEGVDTPDGHVGLITYMRTDSTAMAGVAMGEARDVIAARYGDPYTMPKGRVYKTKAKGAQEAHEAIRPTSFQRDPDSLARVTSSPRSCACRLIWQRAIASQMAAKELETTTVELADGPIRAARQSATRTLFDGFARVYTEGRDDDAEDDAESDRLPALSEGDATSVARRHADPALHPAAAALHRGDADQGARGARHRPAVDLRGHHLDDPATGATSASRSAGCSRSSSPRS